MKTRLDALLRKLERECELAQRAHEAASRQLAQARAALAASKAALLVDDRRGEAADWVLAEVRQKRMQLAIVAGEEKVAAAVRAEAEARAAMVARLQRTEAIRRAAERIRLEAQRARETREARELDEVALQRHRQRG